MKTDNSSKRGAALLIVLGIIVALSALLATVVKGGLQQAYTTTILADKIRAQLIAEAGAHEAYTVLKTNWAARLSDSEFPLTNYGNGTYDVTVVPTNTMASIRSRGTYGRASELAILDVIHLGSTTPGNPTVNWSSVSNYTVVAGGQIVWTGASVFNGNGLLHSNNKFTRTGNGFVEGDISSSVWFETKGNAGGVTGDVTAPRLSGNLSNISGSDTEDSVPFVQIPIIDLTPYYLEALANGEVYNGDLTLSAGEDPVGGILWVNGSLTLAGNADYEGSFIATGDLRINGNGSLTAVDGYPVLISRDGDISFAGEKEVTGLIYAQTGDYTQTGGNILNGQIVVMGDVNKAGNSMIANYVNSPPATPENDDDTENILGLNAWQR